MKSAKPKCEHCSEPALSQVRLCAYHWASHNWGQAWAAKCHPEHPEAQAFLRTGLPRIADKD